MDKREASGVLAQCKWLKDQIKRWEEAAKAVVGDELKAGEKATAIAPDGSELGYVTKAKGKRSMQIDNEDGFLAWVKQRYPSEVVQAVRPAFLKKLQEDMLERGALVDANGEVCQHVSIHQGDEYTFVTLDKFADLLITQSIQSRKLMDVITPQSEIEAPPEPVGTVKDGLIDSRTEIACCCKHPTAPTEGVCDPCVGGAHESCVGPLVPSGLDNVYTGPLDDTTLHCSCGNPDHDVHLPWKVDPEPMQDASVDDPEPALDDHQVGSPMWQDSNTFETSDNVRRLRREE